MPDSGDDLTTPPHPDDLDRAAEAVAANDLRALAWSWLARLSRDLNVDDATRAASWARVLERLGPGPASHADAAMEIAVYGGAIHGIAPRTPEQWAYAHERFDAQTLASLKAWQAKDDSLEAAAGEEPESA